MLVRFTLFLGVIAFYSFVGFSQSTKSHFDNKSYVEGEFLMQIASKNDLETIVRNSPAQYELVVAKEVSKPMHVWLIRFNHQVVSHQAMQEYLYGQRNVSVVDYNYHIQMRSTLPGDPSITQQWHHNNTGQTGGTTDADIDSDLAWDITTGGTTATNDDIVVCLIESGNLDHQDLSPNRWFNVNEIENNGIDDDNNGYVDDYNGWNPIQNNDNYGTGGHGTNCLGMMGAKGDNNLNVVGANWDVKLMVVGDYSISTQADAIEAYTYPLVMRQLWNESDGAEGAFVVATSSSWGIDGANPNNYPLWCSFYDTLGTYGIINVGATTNSNLNVDTAGDMPTACSSPYMVGVGRTDHNDNTAGGYGVTTIEFGAPGINIVTTANTNTITTTTGTSFSCPLTVGVIGLAYSIPCPQFMAIVKANPQMGADMVLQALMDGVDQKAQLATRFISGGRLNSRGTIDALMLTGCNESTCFLPNDIEISDKTETTASVNWTIANEPTSYTLFIRPVGAATWTEISSPGSQANYTFSGLEGCTEYEYYLNVICDQDTSANSAIGVFTTQGCGACTDLQYCGASSSDAQLIQFSITKPTAIASNMTFEAPTAWGANLQTTYAAGELVLVDDGSAADSLGCGALVNPGAVNGKIAVVYRGTCQFSLKALNAQNAGAIGVIFINNVAGTLDMAAGNNGSVITIPVAIVSNSDGAILKAQLDNGATIRAILGTKKEWIEIVELGSLSNTSGDDGGYEQFTSQAPTLVAGTNYTLTISKGYQNQPYETYSRAWIDYNQDGTFETSELVYDQTTDGLSDAVGQISIPTSAQAGNTRLRVMMSYFGPGQTTLPTFCQSYNFGEVEDYCVIIENTNAVNQLDEGLGLKIYPNPMNQELSIFSQNEEANEIQLVDLTGKIVLTSSMNLGSTSLNTSYLESGTYFCVVLSNNGTKLLTKKLVKVE